MLNHAFKIALPPTDPNANLVFQDGFIDDVTKEIVIKDHNSVVLFRIGGGINLWKEDAGNPIYNPFPATILQEDYFPCVIFDANSFSGNGDAFKYKMWHQGDNGTQALSYSNDGINWTLKGQTNLPINTTFHACVCYDVNKFGGAFAYKIWYWTGSATTDMSCMKYAESDDGITWVNIQTMTQDPAQKIVDGISPGYFYHLYGPGFVKYNSTPTSIAGQPFTFRYIMFYDIASEGQGPGSASESIGLAYSDDGLLWSRYSNPLTPPFDTPVFMPSGAGATPNTGLLFDWDGSHAYRPSLVVDSKGVYHLFYSASNLNFNNGLIYAHGIGHLISRDGVTWSKDPLNPIFYYNNGQAWRGGRTYTPFVLIDPVTNVWKMWFTGGSDANAGQNQGIGYATLQ